LLFSSAEVKGCRSIDVITVRDPYGSGRNWGAAAG
jgi:hypothetical protein